MQKEYITIYQRPASVLPLEGDPEYNFLLHLGRVSNTLIFPEYFTFHPDVHNLDDLLNVAGDSLAKLSQLSNQESFKDTMIVGGTMLLAKDNRLFNASPVFYNGTMIDSYFKRNLFTHESKYLTPGDQELVLEHPVMHDLWGFLICADVNKPEYFSNYNRVKYIAIPVASPFLPKDTDEARLYRDLSIFQNGAKISNAIIFKCCLTGHTGMIDNLQSPVDSGKVQGRSLIASPVQILARAAHIHWQGTLSYSTLDGHVKITEY